MENTYIVTGANGFLGNNIMQMLMKNPQNKVRALVSSAGCADALQDLGCSIYTDDVTKDESLKEIFDVPKYMKNYVIHCVATI